MMMLLQCPNCQKEFNAIDNIPRILVFCGHTFCHACLMNLLLIDSQQQQQDLIYGGPEDAQAFKNNGTTENRVNVAHHLKAAIQCPDCGTTNHAHNGIESFPKNLVLLQVN